MNINTLGSLYVIATPIGNIKDITFRAIEVLKTVDCILAEDTRHSQTLLQHYGVSTPISALHEHNERERAAFLIEKLKSGKSIALISDAGTPLISDPGYYLVKELRQAGIPVVPLPGPCAAIAALSVSGLPTDRFVFEGFLPAKSQQRLQRLSLLSEEDRTMVFYEAPHRILDFLEDAISVFGPERSVVYARELTKLFETIHSSQLQALKTWIESDANQMRGEMLVMIEGRKALAVETQAEVKRILVILLESLSLKDAVEFTMKITGEKKNAVYDEALKLKKSD